MMEARMILRFTLMAFSLAISTQQRLQTAVKIGMWQITLEWSGRTERSTLAHTNCYLKLWRRIRMEWSSTKQFSTSLVQESPSKQVSHLFQVNPPAKQVSHLFQISVQLLCGQSSRFSFYFIVITLHNLLFARLFITVYSFFAYKKKHDITIVIKSHTI